MKTDSQEKSFDIIVALLIVAICGTGFFYPEKLWGVHFAAFLSKELAVFFFSIPLLLIISSLFLPEKRVTFQPIIWKITSIVAPIGATLAFYHFPIPNDFYGNARNFYFIKENVINVFPDDIVASFFRFDFIPGQGRNGVKLIVDLISYYSNQSIEQSFILLNTFFGGLYVLVLFQFIATHIQEVKNRVLLLFIFLLSPMFLVYFGHIETYAPVFFLLISWLLLFVKATKNKTPFSLIALAFTGLLGLRFHTLFILLVPAFLILLTNSYAPDLSKKIGTLKKTFLYIYLPLLVLGLLAYFFVFKDYNDPRKLTNFTDIERLFLPILSPEAPLDQYNLFSFNHVLDFINITFLWSPVFLFLILSILSFRKEINWNSLEVSSILLTITIYGTFLFAINPLLSMPMDWDLFMFPVAILSVLIVLLLQRIELSYFTLKRSILLLAIAVLCIPAFITTLSAKENAYRIESLGKHIYKTYYEHAATYLLYAIGQTDSKEAYKTRLERIISDLKPYSLLGNDKQYADLLIDYSYVLADENLENARIAFLQAADYHSPDPKFDEHINYINQRLVEQGYSFSEKDKDLAAEYLENGNKLKSTSITLALKNYRIAFIYHPLSTKINLTLVESYFRLNDFQSAYQQAIYLKSTTNLSSRKKLRILIHTSLEAEKYDACKAHCEVYLSLFPDDKLITDIAKRLKSNSKVEELKYYFKRK